MDIVVEAAFEDMGLKKTIFADLGRITEPSCILASNTSTLDIDEFAAASGRPQEVIGHHFFSPANVMKLLEIVRARDTSKEAIATSLALAKRLLDRSINSPLNSLLVGAVGLGGFVLLLQGVRTVLS